MAQIVLSEEEDSEEKKMGRSLDINGENKKDRQKEEGRKWKIETDGHR